MTELTQDEQMVLRWLAKEDSSALGECEGVPLRSLVLLGFAKIAPELRGGSYDRVSVTDAGFAWLKQHPVTP